MKNNNKKQSKSKKLSSFDMKYDELLKSSHLDTLEFFAEWLIYLLEKANAEIEMRKTSNNSEVKTDE